MMMSFLTLSLTSLFFSHCCIGYRCLTGLFSAFKVSLPCQHHIFQGRQKPMGNNAPFTQEFTQHSPPTLSPLAVSAVISMPHFSLATSDSLSLGSHSHFCRMNVAEPLPAGLTPTLPFIPHFRVENPLHFKHYTYP